jgi:hypothetical protein
LQCTKDIQKNIDISKVDNKNGKKKSKLLTSRIIANSQPDQPGESIKSHEHQAFVYRSKDVTQQGSQISSMTPKMANQQEGVNENESNNKGNGPSVE